MVWPDSSCENCNITEGGKREIAGKLCDNVIVLLIYQSTIQRGIETKVNVHY